MQSTPRLASVDCFRGFAVLMMVLATFLFGRAIRPDWLRHAPDNNITIVDLGAARAAGVKLTTWFPENGLHLQTPAVYPEEFEQRLLGFLQEILGGNDPKPLR